ncbi:MAG TPA: carboxypeptidase-like regulatory domain-containing protein [Verrucomicrobiae bacterium]|nr:carboxypeptidase-like regulatory domain-containing protein [Verrucomicrobiae bacterium]
MNRSVAGFRTASLLISIFLFAGMAQAQYRGSIQGTVTDPQGAVIPGATVTLTDKETNRTLTATTSDAGIYNFSTLPPSHYSMTVEKTGFKKKVLDDVSIIAEQANAVNVQLDIGASNETVTVNAANAPLIDTETAQLSGTVTSQDVQKLPSFGRDVFQLAQLAPGVFGDGSQQQGGGSYQLPGTNSGASGATDGVFKTENAPQIMANGGRLNANNITLDGVGITSVSWGGAAIVTPNEDSVKEVKIVSNSYDAENGRFSGAQIQVISQNGTNDYHGSFFFKADRPGLNSYQAWTGTAGSPTTPQRNTSRFNDWGGSVSGPIIKNKLFGFFAYETIRNKSTNTGTGWYETPALLQSAPSGSLASRYGAYPGEAASFSGVIDQTCGSIGLVEGTNCHEIPGQGLDIGRPLDTTLFPLGTQDPSFVNQFTPGLGGDGTGSAANLDGVADIVDLNTIGPSTQTNQQFNGRVDYNATSKDLIAVNMYRVPVTQTSFNGDRPANLFHHNATNEAETALWDHTFTATLLNELRINAAGWRWNELKDNPQIPLGLPQTAYIGDPSAGGNIGSVCPGCNSPGGPAGSIFDQWTYNLKDVVTKVHGSHTLKFGGEVTKLHFVQDAPWSARPNWGFNNYWDFLNDAPSKEVGTFNPLNGIPTDVRKDSRSTLLGFFVQDDWKLRPNLTVNLGMRWEYFGPLTFLHNQLSSVVLGSGSDALTGMSMRIGGNLYNADKHDFGPELGFAWSPGAIGSHDLSNRLVIRGGFGLSYTGEEEAITLNGWGNIPFTDGGANLLGADIVYDFPTDPHQFEPYPSNPNTIETFNSQNIPTVGAPVAVTGFPANYATPYTYHYSLEGQYDLGGNWVATLGYQGSVSHHLTRQYNLNEIYGAQGIALNPMINDVDWYAQDGNAHSNALLTELAHQLTHSFQFDMQYRYAKSMDNGSQPYNVSNFQWASGGDWGPSDYDVTHAFKLYGIYSPRIFQGGRGWLEKVAGGWSFSGILNAHSGFPFNPTFFSTCDLIYNGGSCSNGSNGSLLPAQYLGGAKHSFSNSTFLSAGGNFPNGGAAYFTAPTFTDCSAPFPTICPGTPQAPGIERNAFRGPRYFDIDATLSKSFGLPTMPVLGEGARIEFRIDAFNLMNSLNLNNVDTNVTDPHFGQATGALGARTVEMQARFSF